MRQLPEQDAYGRLVQEVSSLFLDAPGMSIYLSEAIMSSANARLDLQCILRRIKIISSHHPDTRRDVWSRLNKM
jgi:hypothetical protein